MKLKFDRIEDAVESGVPKIVVWFDIEDAPGGSSKYRYSMPVDIFEHRAAEYEESDLTNLVEMVVAEGAMLLSATPETEDGLETLATAATPEHARRDHLTRCARVKLKYRISTRSGARTLIDELMPRISLDPTSIARKRHTVWSLRERPQAIPIDVTDRAGGR